MIGDFSERADEIDAYLKFVRAFDKRRLRVSDDGDLLIIPEPTDADEGDPAPVPVPTSVLKTLKASSYLLLYNLIESSMRNAVRAIVDDIAETRSSYPQLRLEMRQTILRRFSDAGKRAADELLGTCATGHLTTDVLEPAFHPDRLFSGNVDARRVREVAAEYGFPVSPAAEDEEGCGRHLVDVKEMRNDLAHGIKSFSDVGRDLDFEKVEAAKAATVRLLDQVLQEVERFVTIQGYLEPAGDT